MNIILEYMFLLFIAVYSYMESFVKLFLPVNRKSVAGNIVLITGSGHGIGRRTALEFAKHESILVLWDINQKGVEETADECRKLGATAYAFVVDCSTRNDIYRCAEKTTKSFLSAMMKKDRGHIVTVASIAGQLGVPYLVDYCASKFGLVGFHESLTSELKLLGKDGVKTTCLCPVFVNTGFVQNPSTRVWPVLKTEDVVKCLMEGILTNKKMIIVPSSVKYSLIMNQFLPERVIATMTKMQDIQFSTPYRCDKKED
ncbi:hydroxysteroid (17-beta) dehydrogenase 13 isoform X1 [Xenopus tropicalis]|uniref:Hydroxysteroid (17-beta) dehydrogenase 13 isoform X1 n=1 Tax=Xenopus tropicalis TaxID=8364 RepID=A0A8J1JAX9_XENTR|nr:hydroxysteroid (17-beta) dehydrogenase 13 isoform X1 [Xenopus tropicalis]